ncbi:4-diphosphocytidyl-2-C-methyl-D-erythritolkinase [Streptococcus pyogenes]|nr:4-diphosphocytidyl-2-C-methyl-D-erythritolkinase [Streptococcus pyogenes]VGV73475.1 4-diphosphocytidyl-2-C-methyl-D-erythritolkinase [Streptococcus pyogenes]VGW19745.1 4-diphosphocytidyl-2-C-methyl-D-erythritolkinase [Streptococcus pyogenes]VHC05925.1 4-diphosphocytidyl-2-C-methyl-D-erythritolkinase [Streptococcus pyogenes]VHC70845.1 4-diphosphocytidyl-2-C-methyl-D-erythritolkinase [Streptococcus pyogenes]
MSTTHLVAAIEAGNYNDGILTEMNNLLEDIFIAKRPFIQKIKEKTLQAGAATTLMTGSGPTVFCFVPDRKTNYNSLKGLCKEVFKVRML